MKSNRLKLLILLWIAVCGLWGLWGLEANASLMPCQILLNPSEIVPSQLTVQLPSGLQGVIGATRTVVTTQNDLSHPDEVRTTMTVNGKTSSRVYTAANKKVVATSAAGRVVNQWLDENGRVLQTQVPGMEAVFYAYDSIGRLTQVSEGQAAETRTTQLSYNPQGHLSQVSVDLHWQALGRLNLTQLISGSVY